MEERKDGSQLVTWKVQELFSLIHVAQTIAKCHTSELQYSLERDDILHRQY